MLLLRIGNLYINEFTLTIGLVMSCVICASTPLRYQCPDGCVCLTDGQEANDFTSMTCDVDSVNLESGLLIPKVNELNLHCNGTLSDLDAINNMIRRLRYPDEVNTLAFRACAVNEIKSETFANLTVLRVLEISGGNLTRFNPLVFANLTKLEQLVITGNLILDLVKDPSLHFSDGGLKMAHNYSSNYAIVNNQFVPKATTDDMYSVNITRLDLSLNGITKLATRFFNVFRNIEFLKLQDNNISNLTDISFFELHRLSTIILDSNNITKIPDQAFRDLPNLNTISLSNNNIKNPVINFKGTEFVQSFDLSYNLIDNLPDMFFQGMDSIENLNLTHNSISHISNMVSFAEFKMLKTIDLSHNRLTQIEDGYFVHLIQLESIDLSYNLIKRISSICVDGVQNLRYLNLAFNQLTNFEQFPRLNTDSDSPVVDVIMEGNPLDCDCNMALKLFGVFTGINSVIYPNWPHTNPLKNQRFVHWEALTCDRVHGWYNIVLKDNETMTIGELSNSPLTSFLCDEDVCPNKCVCYSTPAVLQRSKFSTQCYDVNLTNVPGNISNETNALVLSQNRISHLQADAFPSIPYLTSLDMSENYISFIDEQAFNTLRYIVSIDLSLNQITSITAGVFRPLHILNELQLAGNQIEHIERGSFANNTRLQILNLNQNKLKTLPAKFADQTILQQLLLFNNSITTIPDSFGDLLYLAYLDLSYNMITNIPIGVFDKPLGLHVIFLHSNNLTTLPDGVLFANVISNLELVTLEANPWSCSCLNQWLPINLSAIVIGNMTCITANGDLAWPLTDTDSTKFECPGPATHDYFKVVLSVGITLVILMVLVVVMAIVVYLNRITIRSVFALSRFYSRFPAPRPNENER